MIPQMNKKMNTACQQLPRDVDFFAGKAKKNFTCSKNIFIIMLLKFI